MNHFTFSNLKISKLTIAPYAVAEPIARVRLDELSDTMNALLVATCEAFQKRDSLDAAPALAADTAARLKPLVARAGAIINGYDIEHSEDMTTGEQQATVDALFEE